ncbi:MAG: M42 family metallopeptidase [Candidatus Hodarchaeota archaeon]
MQSLLRELVFADGPPGREEEVREIIIREVTPLMDSLDVDDLGNIIARREGASEKTFMLMAHQDEDWALLTTHIDDDGFVRFTRLVGHRWNLLGQRVFIHGKKGKVLGVVGIPAPHLIPLSEQQQGYEPRIEDMFIDCGARDRNEADDLGVAVGQPVTAQKHFSELTQGRLLGNCFDDRAGVAIMIETLRRIHTQRIRMNLVAVASVQEEVGTRGASPVTFRVEPDYAIALDVSPTGDHPNIKAHMVPVRLGKGPALLQTDQYHVTAQPLNNWLLQLAESLKLPLQNVALRTPIHFGTDAAAVELVKKGCKVTALLLPTRYFHTANAVIDYADMEAMVQLLVKGLQSLGQLEAVVK